ncbi:hypothetical protein T484DRAFT_1771376 [Baffinella frigidus]|nr:hypothetical protein T484DRAFT_1771376 [Cryptophyta sp. CCMP2293]
MLGLRYKSVNFGAGKRPLTLQQRMETLALLGVATTPISLLLPAAIASPFSNETLALLGVATTPISLLLPAAIARHTRGARALESFMAAVPLRLLVSLNP